MTSYLPLILEAESSGIEVYEFDFRDQVKGFYYDGAIGIRRQLEDIDKICILAEELGHHYTSYGDITDSAQLNNRKQEKRARIWAHEKLIPLEKLIDGCLACRGLERWELAEYLGVTDEFFCEAIATYKETYGLFVEVGNCCIYFDPLSVALYEFE